MSWALRIGALLINVVSVMILSQLVDLDAGSAIDWIIENQYKFELVPLEPTMEMREAYHEAQERYEDCDGEAPDSHWEAMIHAYRLQVKR